MDTANPLGSPLYDTVQGVTSKVTDYSTFARSRRHGILTGQLWKVLGWYEVLGLLPT